MAKIQKKEGSGGAGAAEILPNGVVSCHQERFIRSNATEESIY